MNHSGFTFEEEQLNRLFPFYILIDENLGISSLGKSLIKLNPEFSRKSFPQVFALQRPQLEEVTFENLLGLGSQLVILQLLIENRITLRGQFEYLGSTRQLLFVGSPWFGSIEEVKGNQLTLHDFAYHDPMIDLLHVLKTQEITNSELTQLLEMVSQQKDNLKRTARQFELLSMAASTNKNAVLFFDADRKIIWANAICKDLLGFDTKEILGLTASHFYGPETDATALTAIEEKIKHKENFTSELLIYRKNGSTFWAQIEGTHVPMGEDKKWVRIATIQDVTEERRRRREIERISLVASSNENGVLFTEMDGKISWANMGFCQLTGFSMEEVLGKTPIELCGGPFTDKTTLELIIQSFRKGESYDHDLIHYRKNGSWFWGRSKGQSVKDSHGVFTGQYFTMIEDVSHDRENEERIKLLSQIAEDNINAIIISNKHEEISWVNKSFTTMTGYSLDEVIGKKPGHFLQGTDTNPETVAYLKNQITKGLNFHAEILNYAKNGKPYWVRVQGQPIRNSRGQVTGFFALEEDITVKKELSEKFLDYERKLRLAFETVGDNIWEHDYRTGKTYFSKSNNEFLGVETTDDSQNETRWWNSVHPEDRPKLERNDKKIRSKEIDSHSLEYRMIRQDGEIRWVLDRGVVFEKDSSGKPLKIIGTHTDITPLKRTEKDLENRVQQFKSLSENIPAVIYEYQFNKDGTEGFRFISPTFENIFGLKCEDFIKNPSLYLHPDDKELFVNSNRKSKDTLTPFVNESRLIIPGHGIFWQSISSSFSYHTADGDLVYTGIIHDITLRKSIEETIKVGEKKYRNIINSMKLGLLEVDNDEMITYANTAFCEMSGYKIEDLLWQKASELLVPVDKREIVENKNALRTEGKSDAYELQVRQRNGELKWWFISGGPRYDDKGEIIGSIGIHLDITSQKNLEEVLIAAKEEAIQLANTKELFLANMSHEIRTPLNAVIGMVRELKLTTLTSNQKLLLTHADTSSGHLLSLVNNILDLSRMSSGNFQLDRTSFSLHTLFQEVNSMVQQLAVEKLLDITFQLPRDEHAHYVGDPARLRQVLINVIGNAIKFTEKGSILVTCLLHGENTTNQSMTITVKDTGIGMDAEFLTTIFENFSQENTSIQRKYGGTGLGMAITKQVIDLMQGRIEVSSEKGVGTQFTIHVTLEKDLIDQATDDASVNDVAIFKGKHILLVEDNEMNRFVAKSMLSRYGIRVTEAEHGAIAVDMIMKSSFDLILMDLQMPLMDGIEATGLIRKKNITTPIIALTANAFKSEIDKCLTVGMNDFISKPFEESVLMNKLLRAWSTHATATTSNANDNQTDNHQAKELKGESTNAEVSYINLDYINRIAPGNEEFRNELFTIFLRQSVTFIETAEQQFIDKKFFELSSTAHQFKPQGSYLGVDSLSEIVRAIEHEAYHEKNEEKISTLLQQAQYLINHVNKEIKKMMAVPF